MRRQSVVMTPRRNSMKKLLVAILLLSPAFVHADVIPTKTLNPIIRISDDTIRLTDKKGNDWTVITSCKIQPAEVTEFTVRSRKLQKGTHVRLSKDLVCEVQKVALI